jgi:hypothetical protein
LRAEAWVLEEAEDCEEGEKGGEGVVAAVRRFAESVAAAGDVVQEVWRWVRRCDAVVLSWEKSVLMRSMTNSAGLVYSGIYISFHPSQYWEIE